MDPVSDLRTWLDLSVTEVEHHPDVIDAIFERRLGGVTVADVFTAAECAEAVGVLSTSRDRSIAAMFGSMLGLPLAQLALQEPDPRVRDRYLDDAELHRAALTEAFGGDPRERVAAAVAALAGGRRVETPSEGGRSYASGNIRWMEPGEGGLPTHVDNEFDCYRDGTLDHLQTLAEMDGHLSWFVILQEPGEGGALSVYDQLYRVHEPSQSNWTDRGRDDADFDGLDAHRVTPPAGSLVVFGGGWRWHRVDPVLSGRPRITYGGFGADAHDHRTLYLWF